MEAEICPKRRDTPVAPAQAGGGMVVTYETGDGGQGKEKEEKAGSANLGGWGIIPAPAAEKTWRENGKARLASTRWDMTTHAVVGRGGRGIRL